MEEIKKIEEACRVLSEKIDYIPDIAVILGSGLGALADEVTNRIEVKYSSLPYFPVPTVQGHAGNFVCGNIENKKVIMMQGRFHYYEGYDMNSVVFPVRVLRKMGVKKIIVTNAAGGVNTSFKPGDLMIINDHINIAFNNPLIGRNIDELGPRFPDMSCPYDKELIQACREAGKLSGIDLKSGVYCMMTGPSYETPAEIKMIRCFGGDAVGMSTVPEVIAANHCGMKVLGISCITNMAAGILNKPLNHKEVMEVSNMVKNKFTILIKKTIINC